VCAKKSRNKIKNLNSECVPILIAKTYNISFHFIKCSYLFTFVSFVFRAIDRFFPNSFNGNQKLCLVNKCFYLNASSSSRQSPAASSSFSLCQKYILLSLLLGQVAPFFASLSSDFRHVFFRHLIIHLEIEDNKGILRDNFSSSPSGSGSGSSACVLAAT